MAAISSNEIIPPYQTVFVPFGPNSTVAGTAVAASTSYRVWVTNQPTYILSIQLVRGTGTVGTVTYQAGYSTSAVPATALTTTAFGDSTVADTATEGLISLPIAAQAPTTPDITTGKPLLLSTGTYVGFVTDAGTVTNSKLTGVIIKYRCP